LSRNASDTGTAVFERIVHLKNLTIRGLICRLRPFLPLVAFVFTGTLGIE